MSRRDAMDWYFLGVVIVGIAIFAVPVVIVFGSPFLAFFLGIWNS